MNRTIIIIVLMVFSLAILSPISCNIQTAFAQEDSYKIQSVKHEVELLYSGHLVLRETIRLSGQLTDDFLLGFPYKYGSSVLEGMAYAADNLFPVSLGVPLADRSGFYGVRVNFPQGAPQVFTVVLILSNKLINFDLEEDVFIFDFPAYPSFVKEVERCNVEIILPEIPQSITIIQEEGEISTTNFYRDNLPAFTYSPAVATFSLPKDSLRIFSIRELTSQITLSPAGKITVFDSYRITNNSPTNIASLKLALPLNAADIAMKDEFGRTITTLTLTSAGDTRFVNTTFISPISSGTSTLITAEYNLPRVSVQVPHFTFTLDLFPEFDYYVETATVTFILPEGAILIDPQLSSIDTSSSLTRGMFQETFSITRKGVSRINQPVRSQDTIQITYAYNYLWVSFRPTIWMWTIVTIGSVIVAIWKRTKTSAPQRVKASEDFTFLSSDHIRVFTEAYEEKNRIASELKNLETRANKGKIPRRRYKVQKRTLEVRLDHVSKNIVELKRIFRNARGVYANLARQLDIAEAELIDIEKNIRTIEVRHMRGELPLESYKRSLAAYERRREKTEAAINGILLRIREEIR